MPAADRKIFTQLINIPSLTTHSSYYKKENCFEQTILFLYLNIFAWTKYTIEKQTRQDNSQIYSAFLA